MSIKAYYLVVTGRKTSLSALGFIYSPRFTVTETIDQGSKNNGVAETQWEANLICPGAMFLGENPTERNCTCSALQKI
eukprot:13661396-Ditylum_brightwellii.AAC.1